MTFAFREITVFILGMLLHLSVVSVHAATHRALVFGLGRQADPSWGKINGDKDVYYVVRMLQEMGYTDICTLKNEQATKQGMVQAFLNLAARCNSGDIVYIHYSGHGQLMTDIDGDESFKWTDSHAQWDESWIPYDAYMVYGPKDKGEKHFCDDEIAKYLTVIRLRIGSRGKLTVVVDACHSGDATCGGDDQCVRGIDLKFNMPRQSGTKVRKPLQERWQTISACKPYQLCTELMDRQVGKLTYALYSMGKDVVGKSNAELEKELNSFMERHQGRLPQNPMVRGRR